ncbi:MAG TPA: uroporphyrinogen decarboxylase family protein [Methylomirabilota bacterium]|nr:uroporphyrinogen decarboxylase family protein [Methylomirabilota bacterium]
MTKRERVLAALDRKPVDRPPLSFWRHAPEVDHTAPGLARAMLDFQQRWDLDFIKVMSSGVYCVEDWGCKVAYAGSPNGAKECTEHAVKSAADWARIKPLDPGTGALGRELEAVRLIAQGRADDVPVLHTLFSPLTIARKLSGERLTRDLREHPKVVLQALEAISETLVRYAGAAVEAGADGFFVATQTSSPEVISADDKARFGLLHLRQVLESLAGKSGFILLHIHGKDIYFDRLADLPVHALNWHDRVTPPTLAQAQQRFRGAVVGGLSEWRTLRTGTPAAAEAEAEDAIAQTGGVGVIVAPGCVLPLDTPDVNLEAVVKAVKKGSPS